mgnify:CR=1 FL=1
MSAVSVTFRRTLGLSRGLYTTALVIGGFLVVAAVLFAFGLQSAEGGRLSLVSVWTASVSPVLPLLAAFLAMDVWSAERQTGRLALLLSASVRERDLVFGKFCGVFMTLAGSVLFFLLSSVAALAAFAPDALSGVRLLSFVPGYVALLVQGTLWCAVAVATSAMTRHGASAACAAVGVTVALPRALWAAFMAWAPQGRTAFGEMPLDAHALDMAAGVISTGTVVGYLVLTVVVLFIATKAVSFSRLVGHGARGLRVTTSVAVALSAAFAVLAILLAVRLDTTVELPVGGGRMRFSPRMRTTLAESSGNLSVSLFLSRSDPNFRSVARFLRALRREADSLGGVRVETRFVDPRWDLGAAERLIRLGATEGSVVFEKGRRVVFLTLADGSSESVCASTIRRILRPPQRRNVCWTFGHGESGFDDYGTFGMSDIARELAREGYQNVRIDLAKDAPDLQVCAFVVVAGAKDDFSRVELGRLDAYLKQGGRLLVLQSAVQGGVSSLLPAWGLRAQMQPLAEARTLSGSDVIVSDFTDHAISAPLRGSQVVLDRPFSYSPSAATEGGVGADRLEYASVAKVGAAAVAAVVERGAGAGADLAIRPTRIAAVGDASFVMNGPLAARANANRDFFLNCVAFLSGTDASAASATETAILMSGMDRQARVKFVSTLAGIVPAVVIFVMLVAVFLRRRR